MKKFKLFFKHNYLQLIYLVLLLGVEFLFFFNVFENMFFSLKSLFLNTIYYITDFFIDANPPDQTLHSIIDNNHGIFNSLLPIDFDVFKERFLLSFRLMINIDVFNSWRVDSLNTLNQVLSFGILFFNFIIIFVLFIFIKRKHQESILENAEDLKDFYDPTDSGALAKFKKLINKLKELKLLKAIKAFFKRLFSSKYVRVCTIFFFAFIIGLLNVAIEALASYIYFITAFDFNILWQFVLVTLINISPFLFNVPIIFHVIIAYIIIDKLRTGHAVRKLERFEEKNKEFIKGTGNATMVTGASGKGKTRTIVDMAMTAEKLIREQFLDIMHEIERKFFRYNFRAFDDHLNKLIESNDINTDSSIIKYIALQKKVYLKENKCDILFDYKGKMDIYDEHSSENIFSALSDYARAYVWYSVPDSLILGNVAISSSRTINRKSLFIPFSPDYFTSGIKDYENRTLSVNFNWDFFRIGKKFRDYKKDELFVPTFGAFAFSEVGKERGSYEANRAVKSSGETPNPKNDLLGVEQKIHRHKASLRHRILFKEFFDEQRPEQLDPDLRRTFETISIIDKDNMKEKLAIGAWRLERRICELIISTNDKLEDSKRMLSFKNTLSSYIRKSLVGLVNRYYTRRINLFKYTEISFNVTNGSIESSSALNDMNITSHEKAKYYLSDKKDFAERYESEYLKNIFHKEISSSGLSMRTVGRFSSYQPTFDELNSQNSYLFESMKIIFGLKK